MDKGTVVWVTVCALVLGLGWAYQRERATLAPKADVSATVPAWSTSVSRLGLRLDAAARECPPDMPGCAKSGRTRFHEFMNGRYGHTRAVAGIYGKRLKRKLLHMAGVVWRRHHTAAHPFHRRAQWRSFKSRDTCWANMSFFYFDTPSDACVKAAHHDRIRQFVMHKVVYCAGQIALAFYGAKGKPRMMRWKLTAGATALCSWDKLNRVMW